MNGSQSASDAWSPQSWRQKPVVQDVVYPAPAPPVPDAQAPDPVLYKRRQDLDNVVNKLEKLPPIVSPTEVRPLSSLRSSDQSPDSSASST